MSGDRSAYSALGLKPGASRAEVDEAYRRLIKRHHPDRSGGDSARAAEINRAYSSLRRQGLASGPQARPVPARTAPPPTASSRGRAARIFAGGTFAAALLAFVLMNLNGGAGSPHRSAMRVAPIDPGAEAAVSAPAVTFEEPLHHAVISSAVNAAVNLYDAQSSEAAEIYSRDCQSSLRREPSVAWFDACAAFDEATITLNNNLDDSGPFSSREVASREMAAARVLSGDLLEADSRLHRIRSEVEMQLLPRLDAAADSPL